MRNLKKALGILLVICFMATVALSGCGQAHQAAAPASSQETKKEESKQEETKKEEPKQEVTIRFGGWATADVEEAYKFAVKDVEKAVPGVKVEFQHYTSDKDFWDTLPAQVAAKTAPDIINSTNEMYMYYIKNGLFASIDDYVKSGIIDVSQYAKSAIDIWTVDGKLYGLPWAANPAAFFINMDMWKAAGLKDLPTTWDEVKTAAKALTKSGVKGICINDHEFHLTQYALSFGGGWGNGQTINSEGNAKGLQFCIDMFKDGLAITPKQAGLGWDGEVFSKKKAAMSTGGYWYVSYLAEAAPDINYEAVPIPKGTVNACTLHSDAFVVLKDATDKELSAKVISYMAREEAQQYNLEKRNAIPSLKKLADSYFSKPVKLKNLKPAIDYAKPFGYPVESRKFTDELLKLFDEAIYSKDSKITGKSIVEEVQKKFQ